MSVNRGGNGHIIEVGVDIWPEGRLGILLGRKWTYKEEENKLSGWD